VAYREPLSPSSWTALAMFMSGDERVIIKKAIEDGKKVELENSSFSDPGPDESRVLVDGVLVFTIPGY